MKQPRILLVDNNQARVQAVRDALSGAMLPQPIFREDGESAVLWVGANNCDLCVISYELPRMNGLETLARLRNRRPNLPAIMYAESAEQKVAIAAFRTGVIDFIPATGEFARVIAEQAYEAIGEHSDYASTFIAQATEDPTLSHIPRSRLEPTYQNRLRTIGRQLDVYGYHTVTITEVDGGFLVRALKQRARRPQALEFPDRDFPRLVASAIGEEVEGDEKPIQQSELTPTGYEDLLRALGYRLDEMKAESIVVTELEEMYVVAGRGNDENSAIPGLIPFHFFLKRDDIEFMLNEAFRRRGRIQPKIQKPDARQGGFRGLLKRLN